MNISTACKILWWNGIPGGLGKKKKAMLQNDSKNSLFGESIFLYLHKCHFIIKNCTRVKNSSMFIQKKYFYYFFYCSPGCMWVRDQNSMSRLSKLHLKCFCYWAGPIGGTPFFFLSFLLALSFYFSLIFFMFCFLLFLKMYYKVDAHTHTPSHTFTHTTCTEDWIRVAKFLDWWSQTSRYRREHWLPLKQYYALMRHQYVKPRVWYLVGLGYQHPPNYPPAGCFFFFVGFVCLFFFVLFSIFRNMWIYFKIIWISSLICMNNNSQICELLKNIFIFF